MLVSTYTIFLTERNIDKYAQSDTEEKVEHLEDNVSVDVSVVFCPDAMYFAASKCKICKETQSTKPVLL